MNQVLIFDTHQTIKHFIRAGFTELQAEVMAEEQKKLLEKNLATKQDLAEVNFKIENLRRDIENIRKDIELLRQETKKDIENIKKDIENIKKEIELLRQETKKDIENIRREIELLRQETKREIELMTNKFTNRMYIAIFSSMGFFITILKVLQL